MPQRRLAQYEEDTHRLPEGFERVGYDADTQRYTFQDTQSPERVLYRGESGMEYGGVMTPLTKQDMQGQTVRPEAFASASRARPRSSTLPVPRTMNSGDAPPPRTFAEILPPELITTSSLSSGAAPPSSSRFSLSFSSKTSTTKTSARQNETPVQTGSTRRLVDAVRRSALPKMQGAVSDLRRSVTSIRRDKNKPSSSRFNIAPNGGASGLSSGSYTRFTDEDDKVAEQGKVREEDESKNGTGGERSM